MIELGQLEARHADFARQNIRVVVVSLEDQTLAQKTQADFPHLVVVPDADRKLSQTLDLIHRHSAADGGDTSAPTTFLIDGQGMLRWTFRPTRLINRLSPDELLGAIAKFAPAGRPMN